MRAKAHPLFRLNRMHPVVIHVFPRGEVGVLFRLRCVAGRDLRFVRRCFMIARSVCIFRGAMVARRAFVMVRGLAVMMLRALRHGLLSE